MSISFLQVGLWRELTTAIKRSRGLADVAVAYFGSDGAGLLPLRKGSRLVVDASLNAVKSGQTHPGALLKLYTRGVAIFSKPGLHAKVVVAGGKAFVGSANASQHSAHALVEAVMVTDEVRVVREVRSFIDSLAVHEIGEAELKRLEKAYRPPKLPGPVPKRGSRAGGRTAARVWLASVTVDALPEAFVEVHEAEGRIARGRMEHPRRHELDDFWMSGSCPYRRGDVIIQIVHERGEPNRVRPPGTVLHTVSRAKGNQRKTFVYLEAPVRRTKLEKVYAKQVGAGVRGLRPGPLGAARAARYLRAWTTRGTKAN